MAFPHVSTSDLRAVIAGGKPFALLDLREEADFAREGHLLFATTAPLGRIECAVQRLVPHRGVTVILCDGGAGLLDAAAPRIADLGYGDVRLLAETPGQWARNGFVVFEGINVPSKAFGEAIATRDGTPHLTPEALASVMEGGDVVVLDCRPAEEYARATIPGAVNCPGSELVYRAAVLAPDPQTRIVVNCAGRTRSIIGAQSLIAAGVPNDVRALRGGVMAWRLAGFETESGAAGYAAAEPPENLDSLRAASRRLAEGAGVRTIASDELAGMMRSPVKPLFVFDIRTPDEFRKGHLAETRNVMGVQLVQKADAYIGTYRAAVVLVDDTGVRAWMTAFWLARMGLWNVLVADGALARAALVEGADAPALDLPPRLRGRDTPAPVTPDELAALVSAGGTRVIDLARSDRYKAAHIPGAAYAAPASLSRHLRGGGGTVLTSPAGYLAMLSAIELTTKAKAAVTWLAGGTRAWSESGRRLTAEKARFLDGPADVYVRPYELDAGREAAMEAYLRWEEGLPGLLDKDRSAAFRA